MFNSEVLTGLDEIFCLAVLDYDFIQEEAYGISVICY